MAVKAKGNQNLNIVARVDGAGNVSSEVKKINSAIRSVGATARDATDPTEDLAEAFNTFSGLGAKVNTALTAASMGIQAATSGIRAMAGAIGGVLGMFGPWISAINLAISAAHALYDYLKDEAVPTSDQTKETTKDLAAAYLQLGEAATVAAAREALANQQKLQKTKDTFNKINAIYDDTDEKLKAAEVRRDEAETKLRVAREYGGKRDRQIAEVNLLNAQKEVNALKEKLAQAQAGLEVAAKRLAVDNQRVEAARNLAKAKEPEDDGSQGVQWAEEIIAEERAREEIAERNRRIAQAEMEQIKNLREAANDAIWAAENHSAEETAERQVALQKEAIAAQIKNAERRAEAFALIDAKAEAEREKREEEARKKRLEDQDKWLAEASKRAAAETRSGDEADPQIQQITARLEALRADESRFLQMSQDQLDQYSEQYAATLAAIVAAEEAKTRRLVELADERAEAERKAAEEAKTATFNRVRDNIALSKSAKEAADAQVKGFSVAAEGLEALGAGQDLVTAAQMTASGIQAACDALDYTAEAAANFAIGNVATGLGLSAAAAGKWAASAAYAKGLLDLGFSAFDSGGGPSDAASDQPVSTAALTGEQQTGPTEINVTMAFSGQAGRLGRYLVEEINAEARTPGGARVNAGVIR